MARNLKDAKLDTRSARSRLARRREPYWANLSSGLSLGYRKAKTGGTWIARHYSAESGRRYCALGSADDSIDTARGIVFSFDQAQAKAREWLASLARSDEGEIESGPYTVGQAMDAYIAFLESSRKTADDARSRDRAFIRPILGEMEVGKLTTDKIRRWFYDLAKQPARLRTKAGKKQRYRPPADDEESQRRRRASANRNLTVLKAALNRAWRDGKVATDAAWRRVEAFHSVDAARTAYLSLAECRRLINACQPDFRRLVQAALQTGARYGQLAALTVADFDPDSATVRLRTRKGRGKEKTYHAALTKEGAEFFAEVCAGRSAGEIIFKKANGSPWGKSHQKRLMADACARAKVASIGIHQLRHTWASHAVVNRVPLIVVAANLGHSGTAMVERHYGHLAPSFIANAIRAGAPRFGQKASNVVRIR